MHHHSNLQNTPPYLTKLCFRDKVFVDICESLSQVWVEFIPAEFWMLLSPSLNSCRVPLFRARRAGPRCRARDAEGQRTQKRLFDSCIIPLAPHRMMTNFPGENWQGDAVPSSLLAGSSVEIFMFQKVVPGHHALLGDAVNWSLPT